jgi:hypothetical protein
VVTSNKIAPNSCSTGKLAWTLQCAQDRQEKRELM